MNLNDLNKYHLSFFYSWLVCMCMNKFMSKKKWKICGLQVGFETNTKILRYI